MDWVYNDLPLWKGINKNAMFWISSFCVSEHYCPKGPSV